MKDMDLIKIAKDMQSMSYSPYSGYRVGAALLCGGGEVITGCNVENISFGSTICAERCAFLKAISEGKGNFKRIAVSVSGEEIGIPCGNCLQFISEFVEPDFEVICANNKGDYKKYKFSELLPYKFKSTKVSGKKIK